MWQQSMILCVLSCSAQHIPNSWRGRTLEMDRRKRNWSWGVLRGPVQKQETRKLCMRPSWRCPAVTSGAPGFPTSKGKRYLFLRSVNQILLSATNVNLTSQTRSVYPDHESKPNHTKRLSTSCDNSKFSHNCRWRAAATSNTWRSAVGGSLPRHRGWGDIMQPCSVAHRTAA